MQGIICIWYGVKANVPDGWVVCDGQNGTPDLRNCFVRSPGHYYAVHQTGGGRYHNHSVQIFSDTHDHQASSSSEPTDIPSGDSIDGTPPEGDFHDETDPHQHDITVDPDGHSHTGLISTADHNPSFYCLWYIMKL